MGFPRTVTSESGVEMGIFHTAQEIVIQSGLDFLKEKKIPVRSGQIVWPNDYCLMLFGNRSIYQEFEALIRNKIESINPILMLNPDGCMRAAIAQYLGINKQCHSRPATPQPTLQSP